MADLRAEVVLNEKEYRQMCYHFAGFSVNLISLLLNENASNIEKIAITETYSVGDTVKEMYRALVKFKKYKVIIDYSITIMVKTNEKGSFVEQIRINRK